MEVQHGDLLRVSIDAHLILTERTRSTAFLEIKNTLQISMFCIDSGSSVHEMYNAQFCKAVLLTLFSISRIAELYGSLGVLVLFCNLHMNYFNFNHV